MKTKYILITLIISALSINASCQNTVDTIKPNEVDPQVYLLIDSLEKTYEAMALIKNVEHSHSILNGMTSRWQLQGAWNNGMGAPSQQYTLNFGMLNTATSTGYWRGGLQRDIHADDHRVWGYGFGFDWMRCMGTGDTKAQLNQLYFEGRWQWIVAALGAKQQMEDLGLGRLPIWQLRISTNGYKFVGTNNIPIAVKANVAYGLISGQQWNQIFLGRPHQGFHEKQAISGGLSIRYGIPLAIYDRRHNAMLFETGVQTGFGGRDEWKGFYRWSSTFTFTNRQLDIKVFDTHFFGKVSCLWSPLYLAGTNFQGIGLIFHNPINEKSTVYTPLVSFSVSENNLYSWMVSIAGTTRAICIPEFCIDYNIRYSYRPITIRPQESTLHNNEYVRSDIQHGLYASLSYELPFHTIHGIYIDCAYAWDICRQGTTDRKGIQIMATWKRNINMGFKF